MISAIIQGFSPVLPILIILFITCLSIFISWWSYHQLTSAPFWKKWGLIILRSVSFIILSLLLFNPYSIQETVQTEIPQVAIYLDNSESMGVPRGEYSGQSDYVQIIDELSNSKDDQLQYSYYLFDEEVEAGDEISLSGSATNLHQTLEHILENESRYAASILLSDGRVTRGRNPQFIAQSLRNPIISIPVGDTSRVQDVAVSGVDFREPIYTNTRIIITPELQQQGYEGEEVQVQLIENGELIDSNTLSFTAPVSNHTLEFTREYSAPGFYEMEINVPPVAGEFTERNNSQRFSFEVLDDKTHILSLAFEIHPDVRSIRRLIATNQQNELISSTYLGNNRFSGSNPSDLEEELDLIVLHGLPERNDPIFDWLQNRQEPIIYLATPNSSDNTSFDESRTLVSFRSESQQALLDVSIGSIDEVQSHPLMELSPVAFNPLPTLQSYQGRYNINPAAERLLQAEFQGNETEIPILVAEDSGNRRRASVNAFNWYRFEQSQQEGAVRFFEELFTNLFSWASTSPERRNLILEPRKETFSENEPIEVRAVLTNERGEPETNALVELRFMNNDGQEDRTFRMNHSQSGVYTATTQGACRT